MDTGKGIFAELSEEKAEELKKLKVPGIFSIGQNLNINGSRFEVADINEDILTLRLLPYK